MSTPHAHVEIWSWGARAPPSGSVIEGLEGNPQSLLCQGPIGSKSGPCFTPIFLALEMFFATLHKTCDVL